jgi:hypothetical protein
MQCAKYGIYTVIDLHAAPGGEKAPLRNIPTEGQVKISDGTLTTGPTSHHVSLIGRTIGSVTVDPLSLRPQGLSGQDNQDLGAPSGGESPRLCLGITNRFLVDTTS